MVNLEDQPLPFPPTLHDRVAALEEMLRDHGWHKKTCPARCGELEAAGVGAVYIPPIACECWAAIG